MSKKRSFQPPPVETTGPEPGAGFKLGRFPKPTVGTRSYESDSEFTKPSDELAPDSNANETAGEYARFDQAGAYQTEEGHTPDLVPTLLPLSKILPSRFQNRTIDEVHVSDLAETIKQEGLNQPVTVRPLPDGFYELIAGEHRYEAFRRLGRFEIPAVIKVVDDIQAAKSLVYDNIFHRPLTDFEVYKGFKTLLDVDKKLSIRGLSKESGFSPSQVGRLMSFGRLPHKVIEILDERPELLGANAAECLARHAEAYEDLVVQAVTLIRDNKLTQKRADAWIKSKTEPKESRRSRVLTYPQGKEFCTISTEKSAIKIVVARGTDINDLEEAIFETLRSRSQLSAPVEGDES